MTRFVRVKVGAKRVTGNAGRGLYLQNMLPRERFASAQPEKYGLLGDADEASKRRLRSCDPDSLPKGYNRW